MGLIGRTGVVTFKFVEDFQNWFIDNAFTSLFKEGFIWEISGEFNLIFTEGFADWFIDAPFAQLFVEDFEGVW